VTGNPRPAAGRGFRISAHIFRRCSTLTRRFIRLF